MARLGSNIASETDRGLVFNREEEEEEEEITTDSGGDSSDMKRGGGRGRLVFTSKLRIYFDQTRIGGC